MYTIPRMDITPETDAPPQVDSPIAYQRPLLPFRFRPYLYMLTLSVGLFIIIPLIACIVYAFFLITGYLSLFLSYSLGIIVATIAVIFIIKSVRSNSYKPAEEGIYIFLVFLWLVISCIVSTFTNGPLYFLSEKLLVLPNITWNYLITFYRDIRIFYWSWLPIIFMTLYGIINLISLGIMKILDWRPQFGLIRFICPHENCGHVNPSLVYKCPCCNKPLGNLRPSRYGIFYKKCPFCDNYLGVSWLTGKNKYSKTCPDCNHELNYEGYGSIPETVFVVEGASRSGKTSFLVEALILWNKLFKSYARFSDPQQEGIVRALAERIKSGVFCPPTKRLTCPKAYLMNCQKMFHSFLAFLYDTGGGSANDIDTGATEPYYNLANGIFLVIDPWAEESVAEKRRNNTLILPNSFKYANQSAALVIGRLCTKLERNNIESNEAGFDIPLCIIVTKCDLNGFNKILDTNKNLTQSLKNWEAHSKQVEEFLKKNGMYNFVNVVKTRFKNNAFFAVSAYNDAKSNSCSVLNPLLWMTSRQN